MAVPSVKLASAFRMVDVCDSPSFRLPELLCQRGLIHNAGMLQGSDAVYGNACRTGRNCQS